MAAEAERQMTKTAPKKDSESGEGLSRSMRLRGYDVEKRQSTKTLQVWVQLRFIGDLLRVHLVVKSP
ncbi:hypothetical protein AUC45_07060 [Erythrobacter sp. YT30]|nr:hypothetical protein AUC45_07060 [Erythrobacter sp. YT30]